MAFNLFLCSLGSRFLNVHRPWVRVGRVPVIHNTGKCLSIWSYLRQPDSPGSARCNTGDRAPTGLNTLALLIPLNGPAEEPLTSAVSGTTD